MATGIIFEEHPFPDKRYTRVAIGDYNNDGYNDLLFNGNALYRNEQGGTVALSDSMNISGSIPTVGFGQISTSTAGLISWPFPTTRRPRRSPDEDQQGSRFVKVNERANEIDDRFPTEGAA